MDHTNALVCTLEGASCLREETLPCQVANGGTVMPTAARVLPGLNMLHSAPLLLLCISLMDKNY